MDTRVILPGLVASLWLLIFTAFPAIASQEADASTAPPASDKLFIISNALKADPANPQLHLEYGQALWWQGRPLLENGQRIAAGKFIQKAEHHLQRVLELTPNPSPEAAVQRGQSFFLLSEISAGLQDDSKEIEWLLLQATTEDPGNEKARDAYTPFDRGDRPAVRTARAGVQTTSLGSRGIPESSTKSPAASATKSSAKSSKPPEAPKDAGAKEAPQPKLNIAETNDAGMPTAILFNGVTMNLVHEAEDVVGPIWAYVPELQDLENWKEMEAIRRHYQYQDPTFLAEKTSEYAHQRGGTVINMTSTKGIGRLVFVTHADESQQSEVNVLYAYAKDEVLFAKHYARRFGGPTHREDSLRAAKANGDTWLEQLALQTINIPF
jgi:hypothetical protein